MELTDKQKEFCIEYVTNGYNRTQAYKAVYPDIKSENAIRAAASRLVTNVNILEYLEKLKKEREETSNTSLFQIIGKFKEISDDPNAELKDKIRALENLCKIFGYYAPEKTESDLTIKNPIIRVGYGIGNE